MPVIEIKMTSGKPPDKVKEMIKQIHNVVKDTLEVPEDVVTVIVDDSYDLDKWSIGGQLCSEIKDS